MVQGHLTPPVTLRHVSEFMHRMTTSQSNQEAQTWQEFRCVAYAMECKPSPEEIVEMALNADPSLRVDLLLQDATGEMPLPWLSV